MKKYRIHIIYLLIIAALAVLSRLKTNELQSEVEQCTQQTAGLLERVKRAQAEARASQEEAARQAARSLREAEMARMQAKIAKEAHEALL